MLMDISMFWNLHITFKGDILCMFHIWKSLQDIFDGNQLYYIDTYHWATPEYISYLLYFDIPAVLHKSDICW